MSDTPENTPRRWSDKGWTAEVVRSEDGGGWALSMTLDGHDDPVIVVPWVMGRNKKDPKPLGEADFKTQLKAAKDFLQRTRNQLRAAHRKQVDVVDLDGNRVTVVFEVVPDEYEPEGLVVAKDSWGEELARQSCSPGLKLTRAVAKGWVDGGFRSLDEGDW